MNAVQCDQCKTFAANPSERYPYPGAARPLPDGWLQIWAGNGQSNTDPQINGEFCSTKCAGRYLIAFRPILVAEKRTA